MQSTAAGADSAVGATREDRSGRMVAPVRINGQGPFRFIVDTGANRSVVSHAVAERLALPTVGEGEVHTVQGVTSASLVAVDSLTYLDLALPSAPLPVMSGLVLAGEQGLLGVDGMLGRRLLLDFEARCIEIVGARNASRLRGQWTQMRGELRFGHLVVVRARINGVRVNVIIDTGSSTSLANYALYSALAFRARRTLSRANTVQMYNAGAPVLLDRAIMVPSMEMNQLEIADMLLYVGDFHVFGLWEMESEPTVLLGMDVLSHARAIAIDYERATVQFRMPVATSNPRQRRALEEAGRER